jgi:ABC-type bacteriocin/lantibiotic exporter with double-glycine peptidase domain
LAQKIIDWFFNKVKELEEKLRVNPVLLNRFRRSIQLDDYSCAAHCVIVILNYYSIKTNLTSILQQLGTSKEDGTDTEPIINLFKSKKLKIEINESATIDDIREAIDHNFPMLITINEWEHWVVIYGYSEERIFIIDSNKSRIFNSIQIEDFIEIWDDNWIAIVSK